MKSPHRVSGAFSRIAILLLGVTCQTISANNWPSFRGNQADGVGEGVPPTTWDIDSGSNVAWQATIEGLALSSPIIWGNKLLLTTAVGKNAHPAFEPDPSWGYRILHETDEWQWKVICLDKRTGRRLWEKTAFRGKPKQGRHSESTYANPTPATDGKLLVALFGSHGLFCYDLEGELKWQTDLGTLSGAPADNPKLDWGYSSSPIIHDGKIIVQGDAPGRAFVAVYDLTNGKQILSIDRNDSTAWSTPAALSVDGRDLIICNGHKNAAAYDMRTGKRIWWLSGRGDVPVPTPIAANGLIFISAAHGGRSLHAVQVNATGNLTPEPGSTRLPPGLAWWSGRQGSYIPTPLMYDGILYVSDERGILSAFDPSTGKQFHATRIVPGRGGMAYASPVAAGGKLFIAKNDGKIHVIESGRRFKRLASNDMKEATMATPAISDGRLYIRTRHHLYCLREGGQDLK